MYQRVDLLTDATATGDAKSWQGGKGAFLVAGDPDGGTVSLQILGPDGSTWLDVSADTTLDAAGAAGFWLPQGQIRAEVDGGSSPSGLYAIAVSM